MANIRFRRGYCEDFGFRSLEFWVPHKVCSSWKGLRATTIKVFVEAQTRVPGLGMWGFGCQLFWLLGEGLRGLDFWFMARGLRCVAYACS